MLLRISPNCSARKKFGNVPECFWGMLPRISPKISLSEKNSGTFLSVLGDCSRGFPLKSASPKKIRAPENFPKVSLPKKFQERSRVFLGTASEDFPQNPPPEKKSGTFPSVFGECCRGFHLKSASRKKFGN